MMSKLGSLPKKLGFAASIVLIAVALALAMSASSAAGTDSSGHIYFGITIDHKYLNLPVNDSQPRRTVSYYVEGEKVRQFEIKLAHENPQFWVFSNVSRFKGRELTVEVDSLEEGSMALEAISNTAQITGSESLYKEKWRPQFHFSSRRGWINDPNGMVYYDGEWHLFYQHNPFGIHPANKHWGHAVSTNLIQWRELQEALYPYTMAEGGCWSGSAVVDADNTSGFQTGSENVIVAAFTDHGTNTESIAYSNDRGRNFTLYENNPVVRHSGRDPKIFWYEPDNRWVMAVFDVRNGSKGIAFYTSTDLKNWKYQSRIEGYLECPEIFKLKVDGENNRTKWVVYAGNARYKIGDFNGEKFTPDHEEKYQVHYGDYYASQTFNNAPKGRRIQIGWAQINMPDMPFNQMMSFPCRLTLRTTDEGIRMFAEPVREIQRLHLKTYLKRNETLGEGDPLFISTSGRLFDIRVEFEPGTADVVGVDLGERKVTYDVGEEELSDMPLEPTDGTISVQILVDRPSIEICGNDGRVYKTDRFLHEEIEEISAFAKGGQAELKELKISKISKLNQPPTADFTYSPSSPTVDNTIQFTDDSTDPDGSISSWSWDFGDGSSSTRENPSHSYSTGGTYTVTLTVTDNDGATDNVSKTIEVKGLKDPWFVDANDEVGLSDLMTVAYHYGESESSPSWLPSADVDESGSIGLSDLMTVAYHYGESWTG